MEIFYYVYVLQSQKDASYYIGFTGDLKRRVKEHNGLGHSFTSRKAPWDLVYFEGYLQKQDAISRERKLKKSSWHKKQLMDRIVDNVD